MRPETPEQNARLRFPRGLEQPESSLRFGADALLLAAFAARQVEARQSAVNMPSGHGRPLAVAELGCGCGAALLGLTLRCPEIVGLGLDREATLVQAARRNAQHLALSDKLFFSTLDIADRSALRTLPFPGQIFSAQAAVAANSLDIVLANPPYDVAGRPSPRSLRERAMRGPDGVGMAASGDTVEIVPKPEVGTALTVFCNAAAALLRHQGHFFCIYDARALPRLCAALHAAKLGIRRLMPVHARAEQPALRILVEARKNAAHDVEMEPPLNLHRAASSSSGPAWTKRALRFCPWLG